MALELISQQRVYGGWLKRFSHTAKSVDCQMTFAIYLPPQAEDSQVPALYWLSGLTCNDENFCQKAGAFRKAAELGIAIICPDTSPRGTELPLEHDNYDLGSGAGFYLNATQEPWNSHYQMFDYVTQELPQLIEKQFPFNGKRSISGHSMGGHGALICALKKPERYQSVSAFAPISNPADSPWGKKAFQHYLGSSLSDWLEWDACTLIRRSKLQRPILVDQGTDDEFLAEQLKPQALSLACTNAEYPLKLRMQPGYDHSYYFISSFIEDHLQFHAEHLTH